MEEESTNNEESKSDEIKKQGIRRRMFSPTKSMGSFVLAVVIVNLISILSIVLALLLWRIRLTLLLVGLGGFVALVLNPPVAWLIKRGWTRSTAALFVFSVSGISVAVVLYLFLHPVYEGANHLVGSFPNLVKDAGAGKGPIGHLVTKLHLEKWVNSNQPKIQKSLNSLAKPALAAGKELLRIIIDSATVLFIAFFILVQGPDLAKAAIDLIFPSQSERASKLGKEISKAVTGYVIGDLLTSLIAGVVVAITLFIFGVPYAAVLAIWVVLVDFLPLVGGLLAGIPVVSVALLHSFPAGVVTLIVFIIYQQIENHALYPLIMAKTTRLNPLWVLLAVLVAADVGSIVGSSLGAIVGAVVAIPIAGALQVVAKEIWSTTHAESSSKTVENEITPN